MHGTTTIPGTQDDSCMEGKGASKTPALSLVLELVCWIEYIPFVRRSSFDAVPGLMLPTILLPFTLMLDLAARMPNPPPLSTSSPHPPRLRSMATPGPFCWLIAMPQPRKVLHLLFPSPSVARLSCAPEQRASPRSATLRHALLAILTVLGVEYVTTFAVQVLERPGVKRYDTARARGHCSSFT